MRFDDEELKFVVDKYVNDGSTYIGAYVIENGEPIDFWGDITVCSMHTAIGGNEVCLDMNNEKRLINAMIKNGLLVMTERIGIRGEFCNYPIGRITKKFFDEVIGDKVDAYNVVFARELDEEE